MLNCFIDARAFYLIVVLSTSEVMLPLTAFILWTAL